MRGEPVHGSCFRAGVANGAEAAETVAERVSAAARDFFHLLWRYDQVLFDISRSVRPTPGSAAQLLQPLQER